MLRPYVDRLITWLEMANARVVRNPWMLVAALLILYGIDGSDYDDLKRLAAHPLTLHPNVERQFLHSSPLLSFLGYPLVQLVGPAATVVIMGVASFAVLAAGFGRLTRGLQPDAVSAVTLVLLSTPLALVLTTWLGKTDPVVVGVYLWLAATPRSQLARCAAALAMTLCHCEISTVVLVGHAVVRPRDAPAVLAGLGLGHLGVLGYHHLLLSAPPVSRSAYAQLHRADTLHGFIANPLAHLVFSLGWFWMSFAIELRRRPRIAHVALVAVALGTASVTYDCTRVATMCALPVIVQVALGLATSPAGLPRFLRRLPFPLVFLLQFQIQDAQRIRDSRWFITDILATATPTAVPGISRAIDDAVVADGPSAPVAATRTRAGYPAPGPDRPATRSIAPARSRAEVRSRARPSRRVRRHTSGRRRRGR